MNKAEKNFFFVNRELLNSNRWLAEKFTRAQAWIDLFGLAQHTDSFFYVRGIRVDVKRGQLAYSQITLASRWKWSRDKVRRYLKCLESDGDIIQQNNEITTLITIVKYDLWQGGNTTDKATEKQQKNIKQDTYNKDNNDNNDNKNTNMLPFLSFWSIYPKKINKTKCEELWKRLPVETQTLILEDIPKRRSDDKWVGGFIKDPERYLKNKQWEDEIIINKGLFTKTTKTIDLTK